MASHSDGAPAGDRRANVRLHRVLAIELEHDGAFSRTVAVDLSMTGFQVACSFGLPVDETVRVRLHLSSGPKVEGLARVAWCVPLELGLYQMGFELDELQSEADFHRLYRYIEGEKLNAEALSGLPPSTLELSAQVTLRNLTTHEVDRLAVLASISELLNSSYRLEELLDRAVRITVEATGAERGMLLLDRGGEELELPACYALTSATSTDYSRSVVDRVLSSGRPLLSLDVRRDERLARSTSLKVLGTRSILCVPVVSGERGFGMIYLDSSVRAGAFTEVDLRLASVIAGLAAAALERAEYFSQMVQNEKMAAVGSLMAGILHELNSPLGSILGIGELLHHRIGDDLTHDLLEEVKRCKSLVRDLLRVTRKEKVELHPVDLGEVVAATAPAVRPEFDRHRAELLLELPSSVPVILGNPDHLRQVVLNLLSNALYEVSERPDGKGRVELRLVPQGHGLLLVVADNGPGIPPENLSRIFDPFFTTKSPDRGTGLGLSVLQRIVTEHGGTIQAGNRSSGGAIFSLEFPVYAVREPGEAS